MNDKQRAEFERWFTSQIDSEYCSTNVKSLLSECWQAAIASVVVELPNHEEYFMTSSLDAAVKMALDKLGVKYE